MPPVNARSAGLPAPETLSRREVLPSGPSPPGPPCAPYRRFPPETPVRISGIRPVRSPPQRRSFLPDDKSRSDGGTDWRAAPAWWKSRHQPGSRRGNRPPARSQTEPDHIRCTGADEGSRPHHSVLPSHPGCPGPKPERMLTQRGLFPAGSSRRLCNVS